MVGRRSEEPHAEISGAVGVVLTSKENLSIKDKIVDPKTPCDSMYFNEGHKILLLAKTPGFTVAL